MGGGGYLIDAFFDVLYGSVLSGDLSIEIRTLANPARDAGVSHRVLPHSHWFGHDLPTTWRTDANIFFGVGLRQRDSTRAVLWPVLWADLDHDQLPDPWPASLPHPTAIVNSGRGLHLYWRLDVPVTNEETVEATIRAIQHALGADRTAAESEHLLRVPGTMNVKHNPPRLVELRHLDAARVYPLSAFAALPPAPPKVRGSSDGVPIVAVPLAWDEVVERLDKKLVALAWAGTTEKVKEAGIGDGSWSDLDYAICAALARLGYSKEQIKGFYVSNPDMALARRRKRDHRPVIEHDDYLDMTVSRAHDVVAKELASSTVARRVGFTVKDGRLFGMLKTGEIQEIANFDAEPLSLVRGETTRGEGSYIETDLVRHDGYRERMFLASKATGNAYALRTAIGSAFIWRGSEAETRNLHEYLLAKNAPLPHKQGTRVLGWHGEVLVASDRVWTLEGPQDRGEWVYTGKAVWTPSLLTDWRTHARRAVLQLLQLHEPAVVWALLGWVMTTFIAPKVRQARGGNATSAGEYSGLWVWGEQGGGKSRTVEQFLRLTASPFANRAGAATVAALQSDLSETNILPVFVDDPKQMFRRSRDSELTIMQVLHHAFLGSTVIKGSKDLSGTREQPLLAPCIGTSELPVEHDPAFAERYLHVVVSKGYRLKHAATTAAFNALTDPDAYPRLEDLAGGFLLGVWTVDVVRAWAKALEATSTIPLPVGDRRRKAVAQVILGLQIAADLLDIKYELSYGGIAEVLWRRSFQYTDDRPDAAYSPALRDLIEHIWNWISDGKLVEGIDFKVVGDALYIDVSRLAHVAAAMTRHLDIPFTRGFLNSLFASNIGNVVKDDNIPVRMEGGEKNRPRCVMLNLSAIETEMGLTGKPWLVARRTTTLGGG